MTEIEANAPRLALGKITASETNDVAVLCPKPLFGGLKLSTFVIADCGLHVLLLTPIDVPR